MLAIIPARATSKGVIGNRQLGRQKGVNIIDCSIENLEKSINLALSKSFIKKCNNQKNIYGDGKSAKLIVNELTDHPLSIVKKFIDIK